MDHEDDIDTTSFKNYFYLEFLNGIDSNVNDIFINVIKKISETNTIENNKIIIYKYCGDIHNAIEIYKMKNNNTFEYEDKKDFYAKLAIVSLYTKFHYLTKNKLFVL
jgi:hypothetical protein